MRAGKETYIKLLLIGVSQQVADLTIKFISPSEVKRICEADQFIEFLDDPQAHTFHIAIAGPLISDLETVEIAQSLRGILKDAKILFCHETREYGFNHKDFVKNGFTDAFLLPFEINEFRSALESFLVKLRELAVYRSVRVVDIQEEAVLDFDLYLLLPANKKYLHYSNAGQSIKSSRLQKLKSHSVGSIFIPLDQMSKFYNYSAARLLTLNRKENGLAETERRDRLQLAVRDLMVSIFTTEQKSDFDEGKQMLTDATEIIRAFLLQSDCRDLYSQIQKIVGDISNSYAHLTNVSTFAALFSMASGIGKPEELALAGLFHDLGLSIIPSSIQEKPTEKWTEKEREIYERHPEYSINLVKDRKIVLPQNIQTMILQHHERIDGKGYPSALTEPKLKQESQLLGIADEFDKFTCFEMGRRALPPEKALSQIAASGKFNSAITDKLCQLFIKLAA